MNEKEEEKVGGVVIKDNPQWGEAVVLGAIGSQEVTVRVPLNLAAVKMMDPVSAVALVLNHRLRVVEQFVQTMASEMAKQQSAASPQVAKEEYSPPPTPAADAATEPETEPAEAPLANDGDDGK